MSPSAAVFFSFRYAVVLAARTRIKELSYRCRTLQGLEVYVNRWKKLLFCARKHDRRAGFHNNPGARRGFRVHQFARTEVVAFPFDPSDIVTRLRNLTLWSNDDDAVSWLLVMVCCHVRLNLKFCCFNMSLLIAGVKEVRSKMRQLRKNRGSTERARLACGNLWCGLTLK